MQNQFSDFWRPSRISAFAFRVFSAFMIGGLGLLTACGPGPTTLPTTAPAPSATLAPASSATPGATSTPRLPVSVGTARPASASVISAENLDQLVELARWGEGVITDAAYSPDGKLIGVSSTLGVSLYQAESLEKLIFMETGSAVGSIAFSPDGKSLAAGMEDGGLQLWNLDGSLVRSLEGHTAKVTTVAFSPDGTLLASGSADMSVRLWQVSDGNPALTIKGHSAYVSSVAFSPDGQAIFSGSLDGTVQRRQVSDGKLLHLFSGRNIVDLSVSADGKTLATYEASYAGEGGDLRLWQIESGEKLQTIKGGNYYAADIHNVALSPDGRLIGERRYEADIRSVALSPDGKFVAAAWSNYTAKIYDSASGVKKKTFNDLKPEPDQYYRGLFVVAFSPDGGSLLLAGFNVLATWDLATGTLARSAEVGSEPIHKIELSTDGQVLAAIQGSNARLWRMSEGKPLSIPAGPIESNGDVALSPDGKSLMVSSFEGIPWMWPVTSIGGSRSFLSEQEDYATGVRISPDGELLAVGMSYPGTVKLLQISDGKLAQVMSLREPMDSVSLAFSPDGNYLASCGHNTINVFRVPARNPYRSFKGAISMAFSPDGKLIAAGAEDRTLHVWKLFTGETLFTLEDLPDSAGRVAFSPDGNLLVAGSADGTITVWNVADGMLLKTWKAHSGSISGLIFTADGKTLISSSWDGTIRFWGSKQ